MFELILLLLIWFIVSIPVALFIGAIFRVSNGGFEDVESTERETI